MISLHYDRDKLVLDMAETVVGSFGFRRKQLGFAMELKNFIKKLKLKGSRELLSKLENPMEA